jgi:hypothetical protein
MIDPDVFSEYVIRTRVVHIIEEDWLALFSPAHDKNILQE